MTDALRTFARAIGWRVAVPSAIFVALAAACWKMTVDDAYITARYAENLARGEGLVFNLGEKVEGFSSPVHALILALASMLGANTLVSAKGVGVGSALGLFLLLGRSRPEAEPSSRNLASWAVLLLLSVDASLVLWSIAGLETVLHCVLLLGGFLLAERALNDHRRAVGPAVLGSCMLLSLGSVTRPEAAAFFALVWLGLAVRARSATKLVRPLALGLAIFVVVFGGVVALRYDYYGEFVPNTYFVKAGGVERVEAGLAYLVRSVTPLGAVAVAFAAATLSPPLVAGSRAWSSTRAPAMRLFVAGGSLQLGFAVWAGGDWMPLGRFVLPAVVLFLVPATAMAESLLVRIDRARSRALARSALIAPATVLFLLQSAHASRSLAHEHWRFAHGLESRLALGRWLRENVPKDTSIAYGDAGALPYSSGLPFIDVNGLVDAEIARILFAHRDAEQRSEFVAETVFRRDPRIIVIPTGGDPRARNLVVPANYRGLAESALLRERYDRVGVLAAYPPGCVPDYPGGRHLVVYVRKGTAISGLADALAQIEGRVAGSCSSPARSLRTRAVVGSLPLRGRRRSSAQVVTPR